MTPSEVLDTVATAIINASEVNDFCQTKYGKAPKVYVGFDLDNPPGTQDYPVIAVAGPFSSDIDDRGMERREDLRISITVCVYNESIETDGQKVTYPGAKEVLDLAWHIRNALRTLGEPVLEFVSEEAEFPFFHPVYILDMTAVVLNFTMP